MNVFPHLVLDVTLRSTVLLGLGLLVVACLRRASAAERHGVLIAALAGLLLLPAGLWMPALRIPIPQRKAVPIPVSIQISATPMAVSSAPVSLPTPPPRDLLPGLLGLLLGGNALFQIARLVIGAGKLRRMRRASASFLLPLGLERRLRENGPVPPVEISAAVSTAMLVGVFRPVIVLPSKAYEWTEDRFEIVLRHELAHLRRGDHLLQPLLSLLRVGYGWQPLLWLALDRLRREREKACDDRVLAEATAPSAYAQALVDAAADLRHGVSGLAMASTSRIEERLRAILDPAVPRRRVGRGILVVATLLGMGGAILVSTLRLEAGEPAPLGKNAASHEMVEITARFAEVPGSLFQDHGTEIFDSVKRGDFAIFNRFPKIDLLSAPQVITSWDTPVIIEVTRMMHYPTGFDMDAQGHRTPKNFVEKPIGTRFDLKAVREGAGINLSGKLVISDFLGFKDDKSIWEPVFQTREMVLLETLADGGTTGLWIPAEHGSPRRTFVILSARIKPAPPKTP